jgi:hypothetical protein
MDGDDAASPMWLAPHRRGLGGFRGFDHRSPNILASKDIRPLLKADLFDKFQMERELNPLNH